MACIVDHKSSKFSKNSTCFHDSNKPLQIFSTIAQSKALKIKIRKSRILKNPGIKLPISWT
jgi:hypothetical protein